LTESLGKKEAIKPPFFLALLIRIKRGSSLQSVFIELNQPGTDGILEEKGKNRVDEANCAQESQFSRPTQGKPEMGPIGLSDFIRVFSKWVHY